MYYILAVFRSRTHTRMFADRLRANGVNCSVVQTPANAHVGCGISVRIARADLGRARAVLSRLPTGSFAGFYEASPHALTRIP